MKTRLLIIIFASLMLSLTILSGDNLAQGLSCEPATLKDQFDVSDAVFVGKVISKEKKSDDSMFYVTFNVTDSFKGMQNQTITILSAETIWKPPFEIGNEYVILAGNFNGFLFDSGECSSSGVPTPEFLAKLKLLKSEILPPRQQLLNGVLPENIVCKDEFVIVIKYDKTPACVKPETKQKLIQRGWTTFAPIQPQIGKSGSFSLDYNNSTYDIRYSIEGAVLNSIQKEKITSYLDIQLDPIHNGSLSIIVPKELIGNKTLGWGGDFVVIIDRLEVDFSIENSDELYSTLVIPITSTSKLVQIVAMYPLSG